MNYALQKGVTVLVWQTPKIPVGKEFDLEKDPFELVARINEWVHAVLSLVILILLLYRTRHLDLLRLLFGFLIRCSFLSFSIILYSSVSNTTTRSNIRLYLTDDGCSVATDEYRACEGFVQLLPFSSTKAVLYQ